MWRAFGSRIQRRGLLHSQYVYHPHGRINGLLSYFFFQLMNGIAWTRFHWGSMMRSRVHRACLVLDITFVNVKCEWCLSCISMLKERLVRDARLLLAPSYHWPQSFLHKARSRLTSIFWPCALECAVDGDSYWWVTNILILNEPISSVWLRETRLWRRKVEEESDAIVRIENA
jgi:hypothetical protein